ncbi:39S ribosomal protein L22, mitochondrial [Aplysia californica]|uniref:Large ribosomal subunit protein uL22m n=1 Tax=Aplysia californica TaxID=6500 RepID=A0ABM0K8R9_APLCA|nr:39S ribosomal protein L22, mitochondrial [Aplysia californica]
MATFCRNLSHSGVMLSRLPSGTIDCLRLHPCLSRIVVATLNAGNPGLHKASLHTATPLAHYRNTDFEDKAPSKIGRVNLVAPNWLKYNDIVYPPSEEGDPPRPAEICHSRFQIKYATKKLWYIAAMIRGMSIDEALQQLSFHKRKGAAHLKEVLEEAQEMAVKEHNVEFKSNLWICDSFVTKGVVVKGYRKHIKGRYGIIHYRYSNFFVRLREGRPPQHYYTPDKTGNQKLEEYIKEQRARRIQLGL